MSWSDRSGMSHIVENLGQNLCNSKDPIWQVDSGKFEDKNLLPITSITYGGIKFENQNAKIKLGALTCHPPEHLYDIKEHLKTLEQKTNITIEKTTNQDTELNILENKLNLHETRISDIEESNAKQTEYMESLQRISEEKNADYDTRIGKLKEQSNDQQAKIDLHETIINQHETAINDFKQIDNNQTKNIEGLQINSDQINKIAENTLRINNLEEQADDQKNKINHV